MSTLWRHLQNSLGTMNVCITFPWYIYNNKSTNISVKQLTLPTKVGRVILATDKVKVLKPAKCTDLQKIYRYRNGSKKSKKATWQSSDTVPKIKKNNSTIVHLHVNSSVPQTPHRHQCVARTPVTCDAWEKWSNKSRDVVGTGRPIHKVPTVKKKKLNP